MGRGLEHLWDDPEGTDETKVECPACAGKGKTKCIVCKGVGISSLEPEPKYGPSVYRWVRCFACEGGDVTCPLCHGLKLVSASRASGFRRKAQ